MEGSKTSKLLIQATEWWYAMLEYETYELVEAHEQITKSKLEHPVKDEDVVKLYILYGICK